MLVRRGPVAREEMDDSVMAAPDAPPQAVVLVSAGASHSVALLSKPTHFVEHGCGCFDCAFR